MIVIAPNCQKHIGSFHVVLQGSFLHLPVNLFGLFKTPTKTQHSKLPKPCTLFLASCILHPAP